MWYGCSSFSVIPSPPAAPPVLTTPSHTGNMFSVPSIRASSSPSGFRPSARSPHGLPWLNVPRFFGFHPVHRRKAKVKFPSLRFLLPPHRSTFRSLLETSPCSALPRRFILPLFQGHHPSRYYGHGNFVSTLTSGRSAKHLGMGCAEASTAPFHHLPSRPPWVKADNLRPV
jgi:hypothetical protein